MKKSVKTIEKPMKYFNCKELQVVAHSPDIDFNLQNFSVAPKFKASDLEKHIFKAFERNKFSSFHEAIGLVLTVAQFFGNLPVIGVLDRDCRNVRFKWKSFRTVYACAYLLVGTFEVSLMVYKGFTKGFNLVTAGENVRLECLRVNRKVSCQNSSCSTATALRNLIFSSTWRLNGEASSVTGTRRRNRFSMNHTR